MKNLLTILLALSLLPFAANANEHKKHHEDAKHEKEEHHHKKHEEKK